MKQAFQTCRIADIAEKVAMGPFGSNIKVETFVPAGVPIISGAHLKGFYVEEDSFNYITEEHAQRLKNSIVYPGDIIFTHAGTVGQAAMIPYNCHYPYYMISQRQFYLRCDKKKVLPEYLVYYFHSHEGQGKLLSNVSQVGVPSIAQPSSFLKKIEVPLPSLETQRRIVGILDSFTKKIEVNDQINRNLEEQAKTIFKSWFIDFEPFQDGEFVDSELGRIPKGWKVGKLADIADITMGQSPSGDSYNEDGDGTVFYQGRGEFSDRFPVRRLYTTEPKRMAKAGDVLLSVRAPVGDINVANEDCCVGRGLAAITTKKGYSSFLLYTLKMNQAQFDKYNGAGTVFGCINKDALNNLTVLVPPECIFFNFENTVHPFDEQYLFKSEENKRLATIRDTLLPKLMSGEFDINIKKENTR